MRILAIVIERGIWVNSIDIVSCKVHSRVGLEGIIAITNVPVVIRPSTVRTGQIILEGVRHFLFVIVEIIIRTADLQGIQTLMHALMQA